MGVRRWKEENVEYLTALSFCHFSDSFDVFVVFDIKCLLILWLALLCDSGCDVFVHCLSGTTELQKLITVRC